MIYMMLMAAMLLAIIFFEDEIVDSLNYFFRE